MSADTILSDPIAELLLPKSPEIQVSGNVILLEISDVVPGWETYTFSLDTLEPGKKDIVLRIKHRAAETSSVEIQTEVAVASKADMCMETDVQAGGDVGAVLIKPDPDITFKLKPLQLVKSDVDEKVPLNTTGDYICCSTVPCNLLIRPNIPANTVYPSKFVIRGFYPRFLPIKIAEKRLPAEEHRARLKKRLRLA